MLRQVLLLCLGVLERGQRDNFSLVYQKNVAVACYSQIKISISLHFSEITLLNYNYLDEQTLIFLLFSDISIGLGPPGQLNQAHIVFNLVLGGVNMWSTFFNQEPCFHGDCKVLSWSLQVLEYRI